MADKPSDSLSVVTARLELMRSPHIVRMRNMHAKSAGLILPAVHPIDDPARVRALPLVGKLRRIVDNQNGPFACAKAATRRLEMAIEDQSSLTRSLEKKQYAAFVAQSWHAGRRLRPIAPLHLLERLAKPLPQSVLNKCTSG